MKKIVLSMVTMLATTQAMADSSVDALRLINRAEYCTDSVQTTQKNIDDVLKAHQLESHRFQVTGMQDGHCTIVYQGETP